MNWNDAQALQFALASFDELNKSVHDLVWKSNLGIATFETYYVHQGVPVFRREASDEMISEFKSNPHTPDNLFGVVRQQILADFGFRFSVDNSFFEEAPELLLGKLSALVSGLDLQNTQIFKPQTDVAWNYQSLDGRLSLPFISKDELGEVTPISLVSKNLPDTE